MPELPAMPTPAELESSPSRKPSSFSRDLFKLVSGTTLAQIIALLASPVIARLYDPDAFGIFALMSSIVSIITAVYSLRYELAIVLPKRASDGANLLAGTLGITILTTILTIPVIWLGGPIIASWLNAPGLLPYLWMIPVLLLFGGVGAGHPVLNVWAGRVRYFKEVSIVQVIRSISVVIGSLTAGFLGIHSAAGLLSGTLLGSLIPPVMLGWHIWSHDKNLFLESVRWNDILANLKRYWKFAVYNTPSALLNTLSWQVPSFLLMMFFSPAVVGYYAFSSQLLRGPMNLIGDSIAQVFHAHASTARHEGKLAEFTETIFRRLVEYSFFPILMLIVVGREVVLVIFGASWAEAGVYIQILSLWMIFWFISSPMSRLY
ncbi:MAG: oligosaccharide flippase family protein, partial [Anaerolineales bacterium]